MPELTEQGRRIVNELSARHGFSADAVQHMMIAVMNGNGTMAQFSHPEFAGSGQWMQGGMTMIGDMFNGYLKGRIESLCSNIASIIQQEGLGLQSGRFQSQSQSGTGHQSQTAGGVRGSSSLFAPDPNQNWWPQELGNPSATGSQNQTQYAYFANAARLAVKTGSSVWVYDTLDHQIGGFSQQQGGSGGMAFTSQYGTVNLNSLRVVLRDGQPVSPPAVPNPIPLATSTPPSPTAEVPTAPMAINTQPSKPTTNEIDIFAAIEKLGELKTKGILTDEEFSEKKRELLLRI